MEWVNKISKVVAYIIVFLVKVIVYPIFYITKTIRIFFLIIEKWSFTVLDSLSFKEEESKEEEKEDELGVSFNPDSYYEKLG